MFRLQADPVEPAGILSSAFSEEDGAVALFLGIVRNHNQGRRVRYLEYHDYPEMTGPEMQRIEAEATRRFDVSRIVVVHRTGRLEIGEVAVAVAVASHHRAAAFDACRFVMDTLKQSLPVWKKEFFEGGDEWIEGQSAPR